MQLRHQLTQLHVVVAMLASSAGRRFTMLVEALLLSQHQVRHLWRAKRYHSASRDNEGSSSSPPVVLQWVRCHGSNRAFAQHRQWQRRSAAHFSL